MNTRLYACAALCVFTLSGCDMYHRWVNNNPPVTPPPVPTASHTTSPLSQKHYDTIATCKLVAISNKEMIVETPDDVMFIDLGPQDKTKLGMLKQGDPITLRGTVTPASKGKPAESDVQDVLLKDGSDVPLE